LPILIEIIGSWTTALRPKADIRVIGY